jgi:hypothetical protein
MAWYDDITSGGLSGLLGTDAPNYLDKMFPVDAEKIRNRALQQGLIGGAISYLKAPKNQNRGYGALIGDVLGGYQTGAQNTYNKQTSDYITGQKLDELQSKKQNEDKLKESIGKYNALDPKATPDVRAKFYTENVVPFLPADKQAEALLPKITQKEVGDNLISYDQYGRETGREKIGMTDYQRKLLSQGRIPVGFAMKPDGTLEPIVGGPADIKTQQKVQGQNDFQTQIDNLRGIYTNLGNIGGITDTSKGALKNIIASAESSGLGQIVGRTVGSEAQKFRDQVDQARPLLLQSIKQATGMSSKQMDSNAELKLYLSSATDPTKSLQANMAALDNIESLYGSGKLHAIGSNAKPNLTEDYKVKKVQEEQVKSKASNVSSQDQEALSWANSNPNDPRSKLIKQKLGVK